MFESFTDSARRIVVLAQEESRRLSHNYIGTEHILLGLVADKEGATAGMLADAGVVSERVQTLVEEIIGRGSHKPAGHIPFTPRSKKVLELSLREALQLGHRHIGPEHILLGLLREGEGVGAQVLHRLGVSLSGLRQQVLGSGGQAEGGARQGKPDIAGELASIHRLLEVYDTDQIRRQLEIYSETFSQVKDRLELLTARVEAIGHEALGEFQKDPAGSEDSPTGDGEKEEGAD